MIKNLITILTQPGIPLVPCGFRKWFRNTVKSLFVRLDCVYIYITPEIKKNCVCAEKRPNQVATLCFVKHTIRPFPTLSDPWLPGCRLESHNLVIRTVCFSLVGYWCSRKKKWLHGWQSTYDVHRNVHHIEPMDGLSVYDSRVHRKLKPKCLWPQKW